MEKSAYGFLKNLDISYEDAVGKVIEALKGEGFGVLTEIDVKETLKKKLDVDFRKYIILGACNPPFAHKALQAENEIGLLLPCNVIVYENDEGKATVSVIDPGAAMSMVDNPQLQEIAGQVTQKLQNVLQSL